MDFIKFNNEEISKLALGTVQFGMDYGISNKEGKPSQTKINEIIEYLCSHKINCFDTAQAYGTSEKALGEALINQKNTHIISKVMSNLFIDNAMENIQKSIENLNISALYGLLLHDSKLLYTWKASYSQIIQLLKKKSISNFGVSIYTEKDFELAISNPSIEFIQIPFNLFDQRAYTNNWFKKAKENNKLLFIRSIYLQGLFFLDETQLSISMYEAKPYISKLKYLSKELNLTINQLALNFVNTIAKEAIILFGCDNINQAKENIDIFNSMQDLNTLELKKIQVAFQNIPATIYNPSLWIQK